MDAKKRILVVDDEETLCEALSFNLESEGYHVDTAYSAEEALSLTLSDYDLVLLDIMLGEISGLQLARIMKVESVDLACAYNILYRKGFGRRHDNRT